MHRDLRLPNICFNVNFEPVLIDFDFSTTCACNDDDDDKDMEMFGNELINCFQKAPLHFKMILFEIS